VATHTKDVWKYSTTGSGEQSVMMVSTTLTPAYFAINSALGKHYQVTYRLCRKVAC